MTREEAENLLDEFLDKHETMMDYVRRDDYIVWTQAAEDNATSEYMQLKNKLIELICGQDSILDKIKEELKDNTYFINEITEKEGIDFETVEKIIDKYKIESEVEE